MSQLSYHNYLFTKKIFEREQRRRKNKLFLSTRKRKEAQKLHVKSPNTLRFIEGVPRLLPIRPTNLDPYGPEIITSFTGGGYNNGSVIGRYSVTMDMMPAFNIRRTLFREYSVSEIRWRIKFRKSGVSEDLINTYRAIQVMYVIDREGNYVLDPTISPFKVLSGKHGQCVLSNGAYPEKLIIQEKTGAKTLAVKDTSSGRVVFVGTTVYNPWLSTTHGNIPHYGLVLYLTGLSERSLIGIQRNTAEDFVDINCEVVIDYRRPLVIP